VTPRRRRPRRTFGAIRKLPSGRFQASYLGPDLVRYVAPNTFTARMDAEGWLHRQRTAIERDEWQPPTTEPARRPATFDEYAAAWLDTRDLRPRTRVLYESLLRTHLSPTFGDQPLRAIDVVKVRQWYAALDTGPTAKANAYGLLRTVLAQAVDDELLASNPARIKGAGTKKRARELRVLTLDEFDQLVAAIPERYKALVLLGGWCALRFGELAALRRCDLDLKNGVVHVRQAVTTVRGQTIVGEPKSAAGRRAVTIPPHIVPTLREHVKQHAAFGREGLVFPPASAEGYLAVSTVHKVFNRAKVRAGRPDVRVHDLRHFGAIMAARSGATLGELQQRLGHSTAQAAMIYQSAVSERPTQIAAALSSLAGHVE
jgi:integrase